jgi:hypothetical protein
MTVAANEVRVQTADAQIAHAITLRDINVLPQLFRLPISLALFNPGMQIDPADWSASRVNGTRQGSNNVRLDGIDVNDTGTPRLPLIGASTNTDSLEEFRIVTSGGKAEYGRNAGAQIELITRSGSNTWHGNAFEYMRKIPHSMPTDSSAIPRAFPVRPSDRTSSVAPSAGESLAAGPSSLLTIRANALPAN